MPYAWQSVEEAALTLGVSSRTLHRRISKGEVETRLENGRREVLVCLPDPEGEEEPQAPFADTPTVTVSSNPPHHVGTDHSTAIVLAEKEIALANEKVRRTELALAAFQHTSTLLQKEANRARISGRLAWGAVAILSVGVYVAVGWTATRLTEFRTNNANLTNQLNQAQSAAQQAELQTERYRDERDTSRQAAARMEGELTTAKATLAAKEKKSATQPSLFVKLFGEP